MNSRAQLETMLISIIAGIIIFMAGMYIMNPLIDMVMASRADLNCSAATTITDGNKLLCLVIAGTIPYFILLVISVSLSVIVNKFISPGGNAE